MSDIVERLRTYEREALAYNSLSIVVSTREVGEAAAEIERLRAERNLLREMFNSAEKELAAERAARIAVASPVRQEGEE